MTKSWIDDTTFLAASLKLIFVVGLPHLMSKENVIRSEAVFSLTSFRMSSRMGQIISNASSLTILLER